MNELIKLGPIRLYIKSFNSGVRPQDENKILAVVLRKKDNQHADGAVSWNMDTGFVDIRSNDGPRGKRTNTAVDYCRVKGLKNLRQLKREIVQLLDGEITKENPGTMLKVFKKNHFLINNGKGKICNCGENCTSEAEGGRAEIHIIGMEKIEAIFMLLPTVIALLEKESKK